MQFWSRLLLKILLSIVVLLSLFVVALGLYLSKGKVLGDRHQPLNSTEPFDYNSSTFYDYIKHTQAYLNESRLQPTSADILQNASPFVLEPKEGCPREADGRFKNGIVLTHGLIASPYSMRPIAEYFQSKCFYVLSVLLPAHASRPGEFINTSWTSWVDVQSFAIAQLSTEAQRIFLSGHSVGGELALYEAATNKDVHALVLFTPAMEITSAAKYARYVAWLGYVFPKAAWFEVREDASLYRYESVTFSAARESYELIQATNEALAKKPLQIPVFMVASVEDNTVKTEAILAFMETQTHSLSETVLFSQHQLESNPKLKVINTSAPEVGVLSTSHLGIMLPETHPEYGREGAYRSCGHYYNDPQNLELCLQGKRDFYGEVTPENLQKGVVERIAFNPYYDELLVELGKFIEQVK